MVQKAMDIIDARREKRSRDLEIREKLEIVVPMISNRALYGRTPPGWRDARELEITGSFSA